MNKIKSSKCHQDSQGAGPWGWTTELERAFNGSEKLKEMALFRLKIMRDLVTFFNCAWKDIEKASPDSS